MNETMLIQQSHRSHSSYQTDSVGDGLLNDK